MAIPVDFGDGLTWHKSRRSGDNAGNCVCVTRSDRDNPVGVRDSKLGAAGEALWCSAAAFDTFLHAVKSGEFDRR